MTGLACLASPCLVLLSQFCYNQHLLNSFWWGDLSSTSSLTTTFLLQLWQLNVAEQMILNDMEINPDKYRGKKLSELSDEEDFDEENAVQHTKVYYKNSLLPKTILVSTILMKLHSSGY